VKVRGEKRMDKGKGKGRKEREEKEERRGEDGPVTQILDPLLQLLVYTTPLRQSPAWEVGCLSPILLN